MIIAVDEKDQDVFSFVWVEDVIKEDPNFCVYQFTRVVFSVSSTPFLFNITLKYHLEQFLKPNEAIVNKLLKSTYFDDVISG